MRVAAYVVLAVIAVITLRALAPWIANLALPFLEAFPLVAIAFVVAVLIALRHDRGMRSSSR